MASKATPTRPHGNGKRHTSRQRHAHANTHAASVSTSRRWSGKVTQTSDALDVQSDIFKSGSATAIADSLKRSAVHSRRKKGSAFQSAMSMLNFYVNRAGRNLPRERKQTLQKAKQALREAFHRAP
jgi:hypothetical protein